MSAAEWLDDALPGPSHRLLRAATEQLMAEEYGLDVGRLSAIAMLIQFGAFGVESDERFHVHGGNDQIAWGLAERLPAGTLQLDRPLTRPAPARLRLRPLLRRHAGRDARRRRRPLPPLHRPAPGRPRRRRPRRAQAPLHRGAGDGHQREAAAPVPPPPLPLRPLQRRILRRADRHLGQLDRRARPPRHPHRLLRRQLRRRPARPRPARPGAPPARRRRAGQGLPRRPRPRRRLRRQRLARPLGLGPLDARLLRRLRTGPVHPLLGLRRPPRRPPPLRRRAHRARRPGLPRRRGRQRRALRHRSGALTR